MIDAYGRPDRKRGQAEIRELDVREHALLRLAIEVPRRNRDRAELLRGAGSRAVGVVHDLAPNRQPGRSPGAPECLAHDAAPGGALLRSMMRFGLDDEPLHGLPGRVTRDQG